MIKLTEREARELMDAALEQAKLARDKGEVPVGAVIAQAGKIIARAHNETEMRHDCSAHAEVLAMRLASQELADWRLENCVLCVTLEPCTMCLGAARLARIPLIVFGAMDSKMGAAGSLYDLSQDARLGPLPRVVSGVLREECGALLREFFVGRRKL